MKKSWKKYLSSLTKDKKNNNNKPMLRIPDRDLKSIFAIGILIAQWFHLSFIIPPMLRPSWYWVCIYVKKVSDPSINEKSLYGSRAGSHFYQIWADFGPVGKTRKKVCYFLGCLFMFSWTKENICIVQAVLCLLGSLASWFTNK